MISEHGDFFLYTMFIYMRCVSIIICLRPVNSSTAGTSTCVATLAVVRCSEASCGKDSKRVVRNPNTNTHIKDAQNGDIYEDLVQIFCCHP